jgi:hypothetical protein
LLAFTTPKQPITGPCAVRSGVISGTGHAGWGTIQIRAGQVVHGARVNDDAGCVIEHEPGEREVFRP